MKAEKVDHICIAVRNLAQAREVYEETLGLELALEYVAESEKIHVARYYIGEVALELMEATGPDSEVAKFIERRGEGVFLISYKVEDVEKGLAELREKGEPTIDKTPRELMGNRYAFIQPPQRLCGVLTEIIDGSFEPDA
ncbi:MAG: VOC family protein [Deltaproteobacteria bacterium]|nr:VOC family protein [Deltaproteobacteria bacterium]MBW1925420.1 VOC family protein [Deltaproteobacteria bacterium]MBW1950999.1 VOC family protein [Deltaproteobacteria bacterium]MBW2009841.1 VOC family protein [Deltaproteobacteria bacterium]MBW2103871.1 VOC family protein [Deltaproteobacteria bacterium]